MKYLIKSKNWLEFHSPEILWAIFSSRNDHYKFKIRSWSLHILPINTVDRTDTFWISFSNIFEHFRIQGTTSREQNSIVNGRMNRILPIKKELLLVHCTTIQVLNNHLCKTLLELVVYIKRNYKLIL